MTAGNVGSYWRLAGGLGRELERAAEDFRLSYGVGLAFKLGGVARIGTYLNIHQPYTNSIS